MKLFQMGLISLAVLMISACEKKDEPVKETATPPQSTSMAAPMPDVGKLDVVATKADGYGASPAAATSEAMKNAILQVNGATIDTGSVQAKFGLDVTDGKDSVSLRAAAFAELVTQKSGGAITNFKIANVVEPEEKGGLYKVSIEANIAHFTAPVDKKIKVVVAPVRFDTKTFVIGSENFSADKVAEDIRQQVSAALANTGRFSVMERQLDADIETELAMIQSGAAPRAETGKLGQAATADVIWSGTINTLVYNRHARQLRTSDRELVSYSGGWGISQKLVNVATRQVMFSDRMQGKATDVAATTMSSGINANMVLQDMQNEIVQSIIASILSRTFPVTVVSRDGNALVLSQGGQAVKTGNRYAIVSIGKEMKDPQTGESLGRLEVPCCEVVIDKVASKLSYGHIENVTISLNNIAEGGLQLREQVKVSAKKEKLEDQDDVAMEKSTPKKRSAGVRNEERSIQESKEDGKW